MKKITLVGITHIDKTSHDKVLRVLTSLKPDAVCLELDEYRLQALLENEKNNETDFQFDVTKNNKEIKSEDDKRKNESFEDLETEINFTDSFSNILDDIGFFESELARITQTELPGKEMLIAYKKAKEIGSEIFLIDRSIHDISKIMEEEVSAEEASKFQQLIDELVFEQKIVAKPIDKVRENKSDIKTIEENISNSDSNEEINLSEVLEIFRNEDSLTNILNIFNKNFPKLYSILLEDRNTYMSKQIIKITLNYSNVVAILGYGHIKEISLILAEMDPSLEIIIAN